MSEQDESREANPEWRADAPLERSKLKVVDIPDMKVSRVLREVGGLFDIPIVAPEIPDDCVVSLKLRDVDWSAILDVVLLPIGYDWYVENGTVWVVDTEEGSDPIYTDFVVRLLRARVEDVADLLRLFPCRDDKESFEILPKWNQVRFHIRKERLLSLKIFLQNIDEDKAAQPGATDNPDDAQR